MKKLLLTLPLVLMLGGCASDGTPVDLVWPTFVPPFVEEATGHEIPSINILGADVTTIGILKGEKQRLALQARALEIADSSLNVGIAAGQATKDGMMGLLAAVGLGTAGVGIPVARRMEPPKKKEKKA